MNKGRNTIVGGAAFLVASSMFNAFISIFTTSLIAKSIGPELYGRYTFGLTYILVFLGLATFGLEAVYVREAAADKKHIPLIMDILHLRSVIAGGFILLAILVAHLMQYPTELIEVIYILCIGLFFQILYESLLGLYKSLEHMHVVALASTGFRVVSALVIVISVYGGLGFFAIVSAYSIANAVVCCGLMIWFHKQLHLFHFRFEPTRWISLIKQGIPFYTSGLLSVFSARISLLVMSKSVGELDLGLYMAALALIESLWFIPSAFQTTFFSAFSRLYGTAPENLGQTYGLATKYLIVMAVGVCTGTILVAAPIIELLFGGRFLGAVPVLQILVFYWALVAISQTQSSLLYAIRKEVIQTKIMILACIVTAALSITLIPKFGIVGGAWSVMLTEGSVVMVSTVVLWQAQLRYRPDNAFVLLPVSVVLMTVVVKLLIGVNLVLAIGAGAITYIGTLFVLKVVSREEQAYLRSMLSAKLFPLKSGSV